MNLAPWPSFEDLRTRRMVPHERLIDRAARSGGGLDVFTIEVPTLAGKFGLGATARGVALLFFPRFAVPEVDARIAAMGLRGGPWGAQRAIEAGLELIAYVGGETASLSTPVDLIFATPFQRDIYNALVSIPAGETITYGELAALAGHPGKARAVGAAMARNPVPIFVPCHRVLPAAGGIGGWSGRPGWKEWLLGHERAKLP